VKKEEHPAKEAFKGIFATRSGTVNKLVGELVSCHSEPV
jgi:hypothetical protein